MVGDFSFKAIRGSVTRITIHGVRQRLGNCEETGENPWTKAQCQQSLSAPHQKNGLLPQNQASRLKVWVLYEFKLHQHVHTDTVAERPLFFHFNMIDSIHCFFSKGLSVWRTVLLKGIQSSVELPANIRKFNSRMSSCSSVLNESRPYPCLTPIAMSFFSFFLFFCVNATYLHEFTEKLASFVCQVECVLRPHSHSSTSQGLIVVCL